MTKEELYKEAEEWTISHVCKDCSRYEECKSKERCTCKECSKEKWQNGAWFGYNKAMEEECKLLKSLLYCTVKSCNNCGKVNCENFQRQRIDCCSLWVSYKDYIVKLEKENAVLKKKNSDEEIEAIRKEVSEEL